MTIHIFFSIIKLLHSTIDYSPPKMAKVLEPRTTTVGSVEGWIPLIEAEEWNSAPLSLKIQVKVSYSV